MKLLLSFEIIVETICYYGTLMEDWWKKETKVRQVLITTQCLLRIYATSGLYSSFHKATLFIQKLTPVKDMPGFRDFQQVQQGAVKSLKKLLCQWTFMCPDNLLCITSLNKKLRQLGCEF